ncbi:MAG: DNA primase [Solirubrobacterales bacterium]
MAGFSRETIDKVRDASDIGELVSVHTDLRRTGQRLTGLCPFHDERTPSFSVNPADKLYYCFGCEASGDVFTFVMETEGVDFGESVELLGERFGVEVEREEQDPKAEAARRRRARYLSALDRASGYYARVLWEGNDRQAVRAREYLAGRGLGEEVLRTFGVGFAPKAWDTLLMRGQQGGFSVAELEGAGLVQPGRKGGHYDRFRGRIVFPIRDGRGRTLGFGARRTDEDASGPKYLNSPEGELYHKSRTLFGIDQARGPIARAQRAIVAEGYTDVLALHQAGIDTAVAVMGTAITPEQLATLSALAEEVVLALDADSAGQDAMVRAQRLAEQRRMRLRVLRMPEGVDPADFFADHGAEEFEAMVEAAVELPEFQVSTILDRADTTSAAGRDQALLRLAPVVDALDESVRRSELERRVADALDLQPSLVRTAMADARSGAGRPQPDQAARQRRPGPARHVVNASPRERREQALLAMCIANPADGQEFLDRLTPGHLSSPLSVRAAEWLAGHLQAPLEGIDREDEELAGLLAKLSTMADASPAPRHALEVNFLQLEVRMLEDQIARVAAGDEEERMQLVRRRAELREELSRSARA